MDKPIRYNITMTITVERGPDDPNPVDWQWEALLSDAIVPLTPIIIYDIRELEE